ncbi:MAG TPA: DUF3418 domain-containing protein, partial [Rhodanobacteraceae bacterium]|nr:DUF3418 domain-containing protein [Rhodanobacteraceae bacterium]
VDPKSDFASVLKLWIAYTAAHEELTQSKLRAWCEEHFLSFLRMREWRELHRQLLLLVTDELKWALDKVPAPANARANPASRSQRDSLPFKGRAGEGMVSASRSDAQRRGTQNQHHPHPNPPLEGEGFRAEGEGLAADRYEAVHRCLLSGWPTQVGMKTERGTYRSTRERSFTIFPGSSLAKSPPPWVLAGQILDLQKVYGMLCARIEPHWIEQQAAHLVRRSWRDVHWSRKRGAVVAFEQVTLFGLTLVEKRPVTFGAQDPKLAHETFVREALARGEIDARADFVRANARMLAEARELEAKRRRSGLVRDEETLASFFAARLPEDIHTAAALDAWYRAATPQQQAALHFSLADVLAESPGVGAREFPSELDVAGHRLGLSYRFVPADPADGVTLRVPLALVNAVPASRCEWLVPGLLPDKVAELIRGLPKTLRRNFVPAPDFARAFAEAEAPRDEALASALAAYLARVTGVAITASDFASIELPPHLSMNFRIFDDAGQTLAESRDLASIQAEWTGAARVAFSRRADVELTREGVDAFDFEEIPDRVISPGGLTAFPALVDLGETTALRVFERRDEATAAHRGGVERLLRRALAEPVKRAQRQLPLRNALMLKWAPLGSAESLRIDLVEGALRELFASRDLDIRGRDDFEHAREEIARALFATAMERHAIVEDIIAGYAELKPLLEPPLMGFARANYDDLEDQLAELFAPGFVRDLSLARLRHLPRYLRAMRLRAERLRQDPARDQARMLTVQLYWRDYLKLRAARGEDALLDELRWLIEELRVSTFAQELGTAEKVSPKRLASMVEALSSDAERGSGHP